MVESEAFYSGVAAVGDVEYGDEFDKWEDIKRVIGKLDVPVPLVREHKDALSVFGVCRQFGLDDKNKQLSIQVSEHDIDGALDDENAVSPRWIKNEDGRIIDIEHIAVGRFEPLCPKNICNIKKSDRSMSEEKQEGNEKETPDDGNELSEKERIDLIVSEKFGEFEDRLLEKLTEASAQKEADADTDADTPARDEKGRFTQSDDEKPKGKIQKKYINKNTDSDESYAKVTDGIKVNAGAPKKEKRKSIFM